MRNRYVCDLEDGVPGFSFINTTKEGGEHMSASKPRESFLIGRSAVTGRLMSVEDARRQPEKTVVERMPLPAKKK